MRLFCRLAPAFLALASLSACAGGGSSTSQQSTPIFTSTPVTAASQGALYTYQLAATDPAGGTVSFAMTTSPTGAALSGTTITWTPAAAQSRVSNNFAVTATSASGGTAAQSWSVSPNGTITVNWVNTYWSSSGPVQVPAADSAAANIEAAVPQSDGSITLLIGSATPTPGVFNVADVPAGYYWLSAGGGGAYWTNTSTFDAGQDIPGPAPPFTSTSSNTFFDFSIAGIAPETTQEAVEFYTEPPAAIALFGIPANSTTLSGTAGYGGNIDWSQINTAFLMQYGVETLGPLSTAVLGPELTLSNLALTNGATNAISGTLNPATQTSLTLSVSGSQWASLLNNAGPAAATGQGSVLTLTAEPYVTGVNESPNESSLVAIPLIAPTPGGLGVLEQSVDPLASSCMDFTGELGGPEFVAIEPPILTDQNFGALQYADPFSSTWTRALAFCQQSIVSIPLPNSGGNYSFLLVDGESAAPSNSPIVPIALPPQNPAINGSSFFTAATIETTAPTLSWSAPAGAAPYGYKVREFLQTTLGGATVLEPYGIYNTAATSMTLPPLPGGNTFVFSIASEVDGAANMQTGPYRSALPTGFSNVVSAPITISGSAAVPQIHGDIEEWRKLIAPKHESQTEAAPQPRMPFSCALPGSEILSAVCEFQ